MPITRIASRLQWKAINRQRNTYEVYATRLILSALNKQIAPVIVAIELGAKNPESKVEVKPLLNALSDLYARVGTRFAVDTYDMLKSGVKDADIWYSSKGIEFYQEKAEVGAIVSEFDAPISQFDVFMRRFVNKEALKRIETMTKNTIKQVRRVLSIADKEGYGADKTARLMEDEFKDINLNRARVIGRTEIVAAQNRGSLLGAISTGIPLKKIWLATPGKRTRDPHRAAHHQEKPIKEPFIVDGEKLEYPGDVKGSAKNVIQCRCTQAYEPI